MKKISDILLTIFSVGILMCLFLGVLSLPGYIVALFIGGDMAPELCAFIFKKFLPWVIRFTSIFAGIGLLGMYLSKLKALSIENETEEN